MRVGSRFRGATHVVVAIALGVVLLFGLAAPAIAALYPILVSPGSGPPGTAVTVSGEGCDPGLVVNSQDHVTVTATFVSTSPVIETFLVDASGSWSGTVLVPADAAAAPATVAGLCFSNGLPSLTTTYTPATYTVTAPSSTTTTTTTTTTTSTTTTQPSTTTTSTTTTTPASTTTPTTTSPNPATTPTTTTVASAEAGSGSSGGDDGGGGSGSTNGTGAGSDSVAGSNGSTEETPSAAAAAAPRSGSVIGTDAGPGNPYQPANADVSEPADEDERPGAARYVTTLDDLELASSTRPDGTWIDEFAWLLALFAAATVSGLTMWLRRMRSRRP